MSEERTNCNNRLVGCFECDGHYKEVIEDYKTEIKGKRHVVKDVPFQRCPKCGDEVLDGNASEIIEAGLESQGVKFRKFHSHNERINHE